MTLNSFSLAWKNDNGINGMWLNMGPLSCGCAPQARVNVQMFTHLKWSNLGTHQQQHEHASKRHANRQDIVYKIPKYEVYNIGYCIRTWMLPTKKATQITWNPSRKGVHIGKHDGHIDLFYMHMQSSKRSSTNILPNSSVSRGSIHRSPTATAWSIVPSRERLIIG